MARHRIYAMSVASVYPAYVAKAEKKGRTREEVDEIVRWLTGHSQETLETELAQKTSFEDFFATAPNMNPDRTLITGVVCGVRVEAVEEPTMREICYLDKLIDELAKGNRWRRSCAATRRFAIDRRAGRGVRNQVLRSEGKVFP
jgi:hypothetical protein